ncbi:response regulator [Paenibacillus abyssi]|uniref:DNA-binding response regulator n=1 Tax=Paenibacillus abyssi TaxID=1340531 RepID=A0A917FNY0_9BACL|nr:response regulator [Paenibacillus abyssi]GGF94985.1 hypothetical protein GCM10010916_10490 [Paenibacillus abyssi]
MEQAWKVLIADDESIIREGIREAVDWSSLQMEVAAEAEDGEEALELALLHRVHIMLVDLNMPIMNGITLIKHIREKHADCKIIIITGHDEFTYAQEAIRLSVDDYILKPARPDQLVKVLENARRDLELMEQKNEHLRMASQQINKNFPLLRERFCHEWLGGDLTREEITEQLQFLQLPVSCPKLCGVIRWPELIVNQPLMKESDRQLLLYAIENIVSEWLEPYQKVMFRDHSGLIVLIAWEGIPESVLKEIERSVQTYLKIAVYLHFEPVEDGVTAVPAAYRRCKTNVYREAHISPMVRRARQYIRDHFTNPEMTLELVAQSLQVSPVYLSRVLKQELGISFVSLLTQLRIQRAIQLLNTTTMQIQEIAEAVGYDTQHYFSTAFKKVTGASPNQYRKGAAFTEDGGVP